MDASLDTPSTAQTTNRAVPVRRPPGRPRRFDEDEVMGIITDLFWTRGYEGVSLSDILTATGLHKGSLYRTFGDKPALYERALARYDREVVEAGCAWMRDGDARARIRELLTLPIEARFAAEGDSRGCFLCNASADATDGQPRIRALAHESMGKLEDGMADMLARAYPAADEDQVTLAGALLLGAYVGLRVRSRHAGSPKELTRIRDGAVAAVDALLG